MASPDEIHCPHCRKSFSADLLAPETARAGYKCPHCKLFIPLDRAEDSRRRNAAA